MVFDIIGATLIVIGVIFSALGVLGVLRLPDTYTRLHASGKTSTLGVIFLCAGVGIIMPAAILKVISLSLFVIFAAPVGSHAIAASVHRGTAVHNEVAEQDPEIDLEASGIHRNLADYIKQAQEQQSSSNTST